MYSSRAKKKKPTSPSDLSGGSERLGVSLDVGGEGAVVVEELDVGTILLDVARVALLDVLLATKGGETPVLGDNDLLATREPRVPLAIMYSLD